MDFRQIQDLIKMINKSNIGELTIEEKDFKITIKQKEEEKLVYAQAPAVHVAAPIHTPAAVPAAPAAPAAPTSGPSSASAAGTDNLITIKSPMIGTFYRKSSPDKPALIEIGDEVAPGKAVCIIEAMKLFNEIESEVSGKIVKVLVEDASPVEYDQPLFLVQPA